MNTSIWSRKTKEQLRTFCETTAEKLGRRLKTHSKDAAAMVASPHAQPSYIKTESVREDGHKSNNQFQRLNNYNQY